MIRDGPADQIVTIEEGKGITPYKFLDFELNRYYRNNGDGTFTDATIPSGLGQTNYRNSSFGARFFDFDNDGWRDLVVTNVHILDNNALYHPSVTYAEERKLYRNMGNGKFADVTSSQDVAFRAPRVGRGLGCRRLRQ